jgi:hypothetical protein
VSTCGPPSICQAYVKSETIHHHTCVFRAILCTVLVMSDGKISRLNGDTYILKRRLGAAAYYVWQAIEALLST